MLPALLPSKLRDTIDLDGEWSFDLDPHNAGTTEGWYDRDLAHTINVPGSWEEQDFGEPAPEFIGGWTKRRSYEGKAWYSRTVEVPSSWDGRRIWLRLDRVGWESVVWIDGRQVGQRDSLSTPHCYDLTDYLRAGSASRIAIRVDNALAGILNYEGHIHSRHTSTRWGGITGSVHLIGIESSFVAGVDVYPDATTKRVRCVVRVDGAGDGDEVVVTASGDAVDGVRGRVGLPPSSGSATEVEVELDLGPDARLWSDSDPYLYDLAVELRTSGSSTPVDAVHDRFGLRTFGKLGRGLVLNGQRVFLRGYVDCSIFPLTGYPPSDKAMYVRQFAKAQEFGFNHVRLHSWTPPREFFEAADEAGMLVQTELPNWGNCNSEEYLASAGDFLSAEFDRVVDYLQRHPSLVIHSMGNESLQPPPGGATFRYSPFLDALVRRGRERDPSRLYADQTGHGYLPEEAERETDLFVMHTFRGSTPDSTSNWQERIAGGKTPVIAHEHTQMDMYARFSEIEKFTGIMEPSWLLQARDGLASKGILDEADRMVESSGALQARCLKELFEQLRRTPGLSGVQMLNFTDFPGQGTALNGVLDVFWDEKGNISAEEFRRFNDETVLLCSAPRRTFPTSGFLETEIAISHFGAEPLDGTLRWTVTTSTGTVLAEGSTELHSVRPGHPWPVAVVELQLPETGSDKLVLTAELDDVARNSWDFWVFDDHRWQDAPRPIRIRTTLSELGDYYPALVSDQYDFLRGSTEDDPERQVLISDRLHVRYVDAVLNGATMIWLAENDEFADHVRSRFEPLFWSFLWFPEQPNQTMGLLVDEHPLLTDFPHDGTSDWQWYHLVDGAAAIGLDGLPGVRPIVSGIDNWNRGKRLGYLFEARVGRGRILVTTLRILDGYHTRPESVRLFDSMLRYVHSNDFAPKSELSLAQLWSIPKTPVGYSRK